MVAWEGSDANQTEWDRLIEVLDSEINASRQLQVMLTSRKRAKDRCSILHRQLILKFD
jgi:hypothetical protein